MNTCGFCASEITDYYCNFCEMNLDDNHISKNGERLNKINKFMGYPGSHEIYKTTPELMTLETIELLCLLREARRNRADIYKIRLLRHKAEEQSGLTNDV